MSSELGEVKILEIDAHHARGVAGNMLFLVWRYETQAAAYIRARATLAELGALHSRGVGVMQVIEPTAVPPDAAARAEFPKMLDLADQFVKHFSIVHEGTGFKAAAVRTITSGVYLLSRRKFPHEVFSSLDVAAQWHATTQATMGLRRDALAIAKVVRTMRDRLAQLPAPGSPA
jgi:hypothetical protein